MNEELPASETIRWSWASSATPGPQEQEPVFDRFLVSRLLLGALSSHEQRQLVVRLVRADEVLREEIAPFLAPLVGAKVDQELSQLEEALAAGVDAELACASLLHTESGKDLEELIQKLSFADFFQLGDITQRIYSWRMAEHLLRRANRADLDLASRRIRFFQAAQVIDGLEILTAAALLSQHPRVFAGLRSRLHEIGAALHPAAESPSAVPAR